MSDITQFNNDGSKIDPENLSYQVMPRTGGPMIEQPESPAAPIGPAPRAGQPIPPSGTTPPPPHHNPLGNKWVYIVVTLILLVIIGGVAYYLLGTGSNSNENTTDAGSKLPKAQLIKYFGKETCDNANVCGDDADPDNDGLSNHKEFIAGTDLMKPDSDLDGLADGDEVNIYKTDPMDKYTDSRPDAEQKDYNDGVSVKNGYDPQTPGFKFTETVLAKIRAAIEQYKQHEPTTTTLMTSNPAGAGGSPGSETTSATKETKIDIVNGAYPNITVTTGEKVTWTNKGSIAIRISSDPHPAHTDLPGFDSPNIATGQSYSYTFTKAGIFSYHNHLTPSSKGIVTVK